MRGFFVSCGRSSAVRPEQAEQEEDVRHVDRVVEVDVRWTAGIETSETAEQLQNVSDADEIVTIEVTWTSHRPGSPGRASRDRIHSGQGELSAARNVQNSPLRLQSGSIQRPVVVRPSRRCRQLTAVFRPVERRRVQCGQVEDFQGLARPIRGPDVGMQSCG